MKNHEDAGKLLPRASDSRRETRQRRNSKFLLQFPLRNKLPRFTNRSTFHAAIYSEPLVSSRLIAKCILQKASATHCRDPAQKEKRRRRRMKRKNTSPSWLGMVMERHLKSAAAAWKMVLKDDRQQEQSPGIWLLEAVRAYVGQISIKTLEDLL